MKALVAFMMWLVFYTSPGSAGHDCIDQYAVAIVAATEDAEERLWLAVLAKFENYDHCDSHEAPFGLSDWRAAHGGRGPTIDAGARIALGGMRSLVRRCGGVANALGHWHHGSAEPSTRWRGPRTHGCWSDWLSHWEMQALYDWRWSDTEGASPVRSAQTRWFGWPRLRRPWSSGP